MNKKGFELAISTIILMVLGMLILIGLALLLTGQFKDFQEKIKGYSGSDLDEVNGVCEYQCVAGHKESFCCEEKKLGKLKITCLDERVSSGCEIDCGGVC